jgi:HemK-related putative methylase
MNKYTIYEPAEDSYLIKKHIKDYAKNNVLEIGTGSAILAIEAAKHADSVLAVDIQKKVIQHCKKTIKNKKIKWKQSNLFQNVSKQQFDCIIFNPPYLPNDMRVKDIALDGGKKGYELTERFLNEANQYLKEDGTILLLFSSLTKKNIIEQIIEDNCLEYKQIDTQSISFETLYVYAITKSTLLKELEQKKIVKVTKFSKGKRGIIYKGIYKNKPAIIKVKNPKSTALSTIKFEVDWLKKVNKHNIGPKLYHATDTFLVMEYIEGILFKEYIEKNTKTRIKAIIKKLMQQLYLFDTLGINKQEMRNPYKHIIIKDHHPTLIDFERCRFTESPRNITQFCQYLTSKTTHPLLKEKEININKEKLQLAAKVYKNNRSKANYNQIVKIIIKKIKKQMNQATQSASKRIQRNVFLKRR